MGGGIIKDAGPYTFVKAVFEGETEQLWFLCDFAVETGDTVVAPKGKAAMPARATVTEVKTVTGAITPVPLRSARKIVSVL